MGDISEGAALLRIEESEVADVTDSPAGLVVTTTDGVRYIDVPEDSPDGAGRTGLMLLAPPKLRTDGTPHLYSFPIYTEPKEPAVPAEPPARATIADVTAWVGDDAERAKVALDAELERDKPRVKLVEKLEEISSRPAEADEGKGDE